MNRFYIHTLGCRVNQYESRGIYEKLTKMGYISVKSPKDADIIILNTCAVTAESGRKSAQMIRKYVADGKITIVLGCYSEMSPEKIEGAYYVGGTAGKQNVYEILKSLPFNSDKEKYEETPIGYLPINDRSRAYIKIEDGCNGKCSYCIIPKLRGKVRVREKQSIIEELNRIASLGVKEVVLTGIEVSAYPDLTELIEAVDEIDGIKRLRFGSLDPRTLTVEFVTALKNSKKFLPHLHISLQSANSRILALMKRPYNKDQAKIYLDRVVDMIPEICFSCDIITSFPSETADELQETLEFIKSYPMIHVHAFPFSAREGTVAAEMKENLTNSQKRRINREFIEKCIEHRETLLDKMVGKTTTVLVEKIIDNTCFGNTEEYLEVSFENRNVSVHDIVNVKIIGKENGNLLGEACE